VGIEEQLQSLVLGDLDFEALERSLDVFCPFEAIGMVDQEIRHGRYLKYILDPQRPHGFGSDCLRAFMTAAAGALAQAGNAAIKPLDVHLMDLDSALIPQAEYKSIDILVEVPAEKIVVVTELKIDASEHSGQLQRYRSTVQTDWPSSDGWQHVFLFLTKRGEDPSVEFGEGWTPVSLDSLVTELKAAYDRGGGVSSARALLSDYISMLRRRHLSDDRLEELARKLWAQHSSALTFLADRRPDFRGTLLSHVLDHRDTFAEKLSSATGLTLVPDHSTQTFVRFGIEDWDAVPGMQTGTGWKPSSRMMVLELTKDRKNGLVIRFVLGPGDSEERTAIFEAIKSSGGDVGGNWPLAPLWRHLAGRVLIKINEDNAPDFDAALKTLESEATKFVEANLPSYSTAMRLLDKSGIA